MDRIFCYRVPEGKSAQHLLWDIEDMLRGAGGTLVSQISPRPLEAYRSWLLPFGTYAGAAIHITAGNGYRYWRDRRRRCSAYVYLFSADEEFCGIGGIAGELEKLIRAYPVFPGQSE